MAKKPETVKMKVVHTPLFTFYADGTDYKVIKREGERVLLEDDAGRRDWLHESFMEINE